MSPGGRGRAVVLGVGLLLAGQAAAQRPGLAPPHADWRTLETEHFRVLYTAGVAPWTEWLAGRLDGLYEGVTEEVGHTPARRLTVIVDDAAVTPGGEVLPFASDPILLLDPTPMEPRWTVAQRPWPVVLAAHELSHAVQSSMGSTGGGPLGLLRPFQVAPIAARAPRWATEGYATLVEGRLTGSNAASSVFRAAVLRTWGVARRLPGYGRLAYSEEFLGANMAYLVGAAFLEHLAARAGDEALPTLWRRLAEPDAPSFQEAFLEVFGAPAPVLYEIFRENVSQQARAAYDVVAEAGFQEGVRLHQFHWRVDGREGGDPALSRDGSLVALSIRPADRPQQVEVWDRTRLREATDTPPVLATLGPHQSVGHESPRFFADGERVLVARHEDRGDGTAGHDLFVWHWATGELRRVTRDAGVREGDPSPDGASAVAIRVHGGLTDLVRVELATGHVDVLVPGAPTRILARPRWSPDGEQVALVVQEAGRARIALVDVATKTLRHVDPDDGVNRYDPAFLGRDSIVLVSERGGVADVAVLDAATRRERPLTRLATGAFWPTAAADGTVLFMALNPEGLDLRRIGVDAAPARGDVTFPPELFPAVAVRGPAAPPLSPGPAPASQPYGAGARLQDLLPGIVFGPDALAVTLTFRNRDLLRRRTWSLEGAFGEGELWRGASSTVLWRDRDPNLTAHVFVAEQRSSEFGDPAFLDPALDVLYSGILLRASRPPLSADSTRVLAAGVTAGHLHADRGDATRIAAFAEGGAGHVVHSGGGSVVLRATARVEGGWTGGAGWGRVVGRASGEAGSPSTGRLRAAVDAGRLLGDADAFEYFVVGGPPLSLVDADVLPQRYPMAALTFGARGGKDLLAARLDYTFAQLPTLYLWMTSADNPTSRLTWIAGAEKAFFVGDRRVSWLLPGLSALVGGGMEITSIRGARGSRALRAYFSLTYRP